MKLNFKKTANSKPDINLSYKNITTAGDQAKLSNHIIKRSGVLFSVAHSPGTKTTEIDFAR